MDEHLASPDPSDVDAYAWHVAVDAYADVAWVEARRAGLDHDEASLVCESVWLRFLDAVETRTLLREASSISEWVAQAVRGESDRLRRLASWYQNQKVADRGERVIDLTEELSPRRNR